MAACIVSGQYKYSLSTARMCMNSGSGLSALLLLLLPYRLAELLHVTKAYASGLLPACAWHLVLVRAVVVVHLTAELLPVSASLGAADPCMGMKNKSEHSHSCSFSTVW